MENIDRTAEESSSESETEENSEPEDIGCTEDGAEMDASGTMEDGSIVISDTAEDDTRDNICDEAEAAEMEEPAADTGEAGASSGAEDGSGMNGSDNVEDGSVVIFNTAEDVIRTNTSEEAEAADTEEQAADIGEAGASSGTEDGAGMDANGTMEDGSVVISDTAEDDTRDNICDEAEAADMEEPAADTGEAGASSEPMEAEPSQEVVDLEAEKMDQDGSQEEVEGVKPKEEASEAEVITIEDESAKDDTKEEKSKEKEESKEDKDKDKDGKKDPYSYTKRDEFTSETFKIELSGLPRYFPIGQLKKLLNQTLKLSAHKVKPAGVGKSTAYVNFKEEAARQKALQKLEGYKWKKCTLHAQPAKPVKDPLIEKANNEEPEEDDGLTVEEKVAKSVTPLAHLPYEEQLVEKEKSAEKAIRKFGAELAHANTEISEWIRWQKVRRGGLVCETEKIVPSPITEGYRNKCEFSIGMHPTSEERTVGFRLSSYKKGSVSVGPVAHLRHIPDSMKVVVRVFEQYVRASPHKPFDPTNHEGVWRQLTVRTSNNGDLLIVVVIHPQDMTEDNLKELKEDIVKFFTEGDGREANVTSIFYQAQAQKESGETEEFEHLWGGKTITETVLGKKFRVSANAFLQVNTPAAEVLYNKIGELAELDQTNILLDICSGTGTIGIALAEECFKVYGVEMVESAVEDAKFNASSNALANVNYFAGRAEEVLPTVVNRAEQYNTVGVVDPPRAGLNNKVTHTLRKCTNMRRLVYISCDPLNAVKNFIELGRPKSKQYKGEFFIPIKAIPVDLFPHTPHIELIILFERYDELKWRRMIEGNPLPRDEEYYKRIPVLSIKEMLEMEQKVQVEEDKEYEEELRSTKKGKKLLQELEHAKKDRGRSFYGGGSEYSDYARGYYQESDVNSEVRRELKRILEKDLERNLERVLEEQGLSRDLLNEYRPSVDIGPEYNREHGGQGYGGGYASGYGSDMAAGYGSGYGRGGSNYGHDGSNYGHAGNDSGSSFSNAGYGNSSFRSLLGNYTPFSNFNPRFGHELSPLRFGRNNRDGNDPNAYYGGSGDRPYKMPRY
ncbi:uncharacterized protein LOC143028527 isoform X1 [Oratosquilla oratoria]|uniref:uncharacterized protein LOC143028527 isoform X1 n=2 Tax=Oratosquilla oratoria TaxID=337810 RepID=UPI003F75DD3A